MRGCDEEKKFCFLFREDRVEGCIVEVELLLNNL